jgi:hypothetical protein
MDSRINPANELAAGRTEPAWRIIASPVIWAAHFLLCYVTAAIWCAKAGDPQSSLWTVRVAILIFTAVALLAIGGVGYGGYRSHTLGSAALPHDADSPEDRHRFLGFATLLLSGLSAVAVFYAALAAIFIETCQ